MKYWQALNYQNQGMDALRVAGIPSNQYGEYVFEDGSFVVFHALSGLWYAFDNEGNEVANWHSAC